MDNRNRSRDRFGVSRINTGQAAGENEMGGRANRNKLGQALDDAEDNGLYKIHMKRAAAGVDLSFRTRYCGR